MSEFGYTSLARERLGNHKMPVKDKGPSAEGFTVSDFIMQAREKPISHSAADAVLCQSCQNMELTFFDPNCPGCQDIILEPTTTIPQIFAVMRQWVPQVQQNIEFLVKEVLRRGAHVNDRDGLTDMSMLHYACKAGAVGVGDASTASTVVSGLIYKGADVSQKCRWTDMLPLHYAAFFDVTPILRILLKESNAKDVDMRCKEFDSGTALHIAASNLCLDAARCLLQHGADAYLRDKLNRSPLDCVPDVTAYEAESDPAIVAAKMTRLLSEAEPKETSSEHEKENMNTVSLASLGVAIGDRVFVGGTKNGVLRFWGSTEFAPGEWAGVELDQPVGKNDGSVGGVEYFQCIPKHGIFAPVSKISKNQSSLPVSRSSSRPVSALRRPPGEATKLGSQPNSRPSSRPSSRPNSRPSSRSSSPAPTPRSDDAEIAKNFEIGDRVLVAGQKPGAVQFIGETQFASGWWLGIELSHPVGKNDGSVGGVRYFTCKPRYGVFAPVSKVLKDPEAHNQSESSFAIPTAPAPKTHYSSHGSLLETSSRGSQSDVSITESDLSYKSTAKHATNSSNPDLSHRRGSADRNGSRRGSLNTPHKPKSSKAEFYLTEGMSILVNSELGIVRHIGVVEFAEGIWLGVEMRKPVGKNDGAVNGKRYFTCKPNYGLMVRPSRASCRGINCAKLVEDMMS